MRFGTGFARQTNFRNCRRSWPLLTRMAILRSYCMGVQEKSAPQNARLLVRGEIDQAAQSVARGFPQVLCSTRVSIDPNKSGRLDLARWIGSDREPSHRTSDGEPNLAAHDRPRHRHVDRKFWCDGAGTQSSRIARLLGRAICRVGLVGQERNSRDRYFAHLSSQIGVQREASRIRSRQCIRVACQPPAT